MLGRGGLRDGKNEWSMNAWLSENSPCFTLWIQDTDSREVEIRVDVRGLYWKHERSGRCREWAWHGSGRSGSGPAPMRGARYRGYGRTYYVASSVLVRRHVLSASFSTRNAKRKYELVLVAKGRP